jgi:hypothetical protein
MAKYLPAFLVLIPMSLQTISGMYVAVEDGGKAQQVGGPRGITDSPFAP